MSNTIRTILRNRLRRHADQLLIAQVIEGEFGAASISDLRKADLITTCQRFGLEVPSEAEISAFEEARAKGRNFDDAIAAADQIADAAGGAAFAGQKLAPAISVAGPDSSYQDDQDDDEDDADESAGQLTIELNPQHVEAAKIADQDDTTRKEAKALVDKTLKLLGAGDFVGFNDSLSEIALRAVRPDPEPVYIQAPEASGAGPVALARRVGIKDMVQAGLPAPMVGAVNKTRLAVYDAADAPAVDPGYIWPDLTAPMLTQLARGRTVFCYGPAGTGKTSWAQQVAARWGRPFVRISCDDQTEAATLVGMTVPDKDGGARWQDGQLTKAIRRPGAVILVDEPSVARPGALFVLQAVLDADRRIHIAETGEVVHVAPDVIFVLADNTNGTGDITGAYEATRRLNRAFLDRAGITVRFDYMSQQDEARALAARTGCYKKLALDLVKFANLTRQKAQTGDVSHPLGLRRLMALAELVTDGTSEDLAFQMAVIETAPFDDQEPLRQMWTADFRKGRNAKVSA